MPKLKKQSAQMRAKKYKSYIQEKLKTDDAFKAKQRLCSSQCMKERRQNDLNFKESQKKLSAEITQQKMHTDSEYAKQRKEKSVVAIKNRMQKDENYAEQRREQNVASKKKAMESNPEYAAMRKEQSVAAVKLKMQTDQEYAEKRREQSIASQKKTMESNPEYAAQRRELIANAVKTLRQDDQRREIEREKDRISKENAKKQREEKQKEKNAQLAQDRAQQNSVSCKFRVEFLQNLKESMKNKSTSKDEKLAIKRFLTFIQELREVPCEICCCCECIFFKDYIARFDLNILFQKYSVALKAYNLKPKNVKNSKNERIEFKDVDEFKKYIVGFDSGKICLTCKRNLQTGKIPLINPQCGIKVNEVPIEISSLTDLEERFVTFFTPFLQLKSLKPYACNPQLGIKGAVINIAPKMNEMYQVLPRKFNQTCTIQIDFKRDLSHKTSYMHETISVKKIMTALKLLIKTELYKEYDIRIDEKAFEQYDPENPETQLNFIVSGNASSMQQTVDKLKSDAKEIISLEINSSQNCEEISNIDSKVCNQFTSVVGEQNELKYVIFKNSFSAKYKNERDMMFELLCAFNSTIHGLYASYQLNPSFHDYVESKKSIIELFNFLTEIKNFKTFEKYDKYIEFLYEKTDAGIMITASEKDEGRKDMANDCSMIIENFLTSKDQNCLHASYRKNAYCNKIDCDGISSDIDEKCMIFIPLQEGKSLKDLQARIESRAENFSELDIPFNCGNCGENIILADDSKYKTEYSDLLIVNVHSFTSNGFEAIAKLNIYEDIPSHLHIGDEDYDLIFFIHKSSFHYKTFYKYAKTYILLDDHYNPPDQNGIFTRCEKIIDARDIKEGVNPSILFYYKREKVLNKDLKIKENKFSSIDYSTIFKDFRFQNSNIEEKIVNELDGHENDDQNMIIDDEMMEEISEIEAVHKELDDQHLEEVMLLGDDDVEYLFNELETDINVNNGLAKNNVKVIAPGQGMKPIPSKDIPHLDEIAFPKTYGGNKMKYDRMKISYTRATRAEIKHYKRKRCRTNLLLFKAKEKIKRDLGNAINIALRKMTKGGKLTAKDVRDGIILNEAIGKNVAYRLMPTIRTGPMYLKKKKNHATAMLRQLGGFNIFLTISQGEYASPELLQQIHKNFTGGEITPLEALNLNHATKSKYVRDDPITCSEYFHHRVRKLDTYMNDTKGHGLFGNNYVTAFIKRKECQGRGSMHSHQLLKNNGAPKLIPYEKDENKRKVNEKEVVDFIDQHITTEYLEDHPNMKFQLHSCRPECRKGNKGNMNKCRFGYPKFVSPKTMVMYPLPQKEKTPEIIKRLKKIREKMIFYKNTKKLDSFEDILKDLNLTEVQYFEAVCCSFKRIEILYKRKSNAIAVNTYNRKLLDVLEANHDIQFIPESYSFMNYLLSYTLKADEGMLNMMKKAEEECRAGNKTLIETLRKVSNAFHGSSFIYAQQAVEEIEGFPVLKFSHAEKFINTNIPEKRVSIRKSMKELKEMDDDDDNIALPDFISQYAKRPKHLENICLVDFAALYKRKGEREVESDDEDSDDDECKPRIKRDYVLRTKERIIRYVNFKREINEKEYMREMVMLYYPWRNEEKELLEHDNVAKTFAENSEEILQKYARYNSLNMEELERLEKEVEEQLKPYKDLEIEEFENLEEETAFIPKVDVFQELGIVPKDKNCNVSKADVGTYSLTRPAKIDVKELYEDLRKLNKLQQKFVQHIFHAIKTLKEYEAFPKILLLGAAGTGKSLVLRTLNQLLTHFYDNVRGENPDLSKVLLAAYTGIAAFLIGGNTCHNAFALKIGFKGRSLESDSSKNTIKSAHREIKAIIIDELSFICRKATVVSLTTY